MKAWPRHDLVLQVPDQGHQILVIMVARARGLDVFVPGRSRKRVVFKCTEPEAYTAVKAAKKLCCALESKRLKALVDVLQDNGFNVPVGVTSALSALERKAANHDEHPNSQ